MVESSTSKQIEKANMLLLSKEMNDKDRSMKTQLLIKSGDSDEKLSGEKVWKENGYFNDIRPELNLVKVNMPENTLFYVNQGFIWTVKNGDLAMYIQNFILGQLIVAANQPDNIDEYHCAENEVKLLSCVYDLESGDFKGVRLMLAYIILRRDDEEVFFSYGYDKSKSKVLYSYSKEQIPNAFISTSFKRHFNEIVNEKKDEVSSNLFYYLPSISDREESINQWKNNPSLSPVDFTLDFIESFSLQQNEKFQPHLLDSTDQKIRKPQTQILYGLFKHMAKHSNQNLERNITYLNLERKSNEMEWSTSRFNSAKFKLTY